MMIRFWIAPSVDGGFDLVDEFFPRNQADVETFVAGAFGRHLIFDVQRGDAGALEFAHGARDVDRVAVAGFGVADDGNVDGVDDFARFVDHFREGEQARRRQNRERDVVRCRKYARGESRAIRPGALECRRCNSAPDDTPAAASSL